MLENLNTLETYLDYVYLNKPKHLKLSIKTRLGYQDTDNFQNLFNLYNKYPIYELIIHSRIRDDMYHKPIRLDIYKEIQKLSYHHLIYNGDIFNHTSFQDTDNMLGRGLLRRPDLASLLKNNTLYSKQDLYKYMQELADNYYALYKDDKLTLFKMKELWAHFHLSFVENKKGFKKILKSQTVSIYKDNVEAYFNMTNLLSI